MDNVTSLDSKPKPKSEKIILDKYIKAIVSGFIIIGSLYGGFQGFSLIEDRYNQVNQIKLLEINLQKVISETDCLTNSNQMYMAEKFIRLYRPSLKQAEEEKNRSDIKKFKEKINEYEERLDLLDKKRKEELNCLDSHTP